MKHNAISIACAAALAGSLAATPSRADVLGDLSNGAKSLGEGLTDVITNTGKIALGQSQLLPLSPALAPFVGASQLEETTLGTDNLSRLIKPNVGEAQILQRASGDIITTVTKASGDVITTSVKAGSDTVATYTKGFTDTSNQALRSFSDAVDAATAVGRFTKNNILDKPQILENAWHRIEQGKYVDAIFGLSADNYKSESKNFFKATQESALLDQAASSAAAVYGGPGGAAAYAAWQTYNQTGDATLAFKMGMLAGVQSQLSAGQKLSPTDPASEILKKAVFAGAAGGIAVAAQGGDENAITNGFLKSSGAVLIQGSQNQLAAYSPTVANAAEAVTCISAKDVDCISNISYVRDAKGKLVRDLKGKFQQDEANPIDPKATIGQWTGINLNTAENRANKIVADISKLPGSQTIALLKGQIVMTTTLGKTQAMPYGQPQVVLTVVGSTPPFKFDRTIGPNTPTKATTGNGNYTCTIGAIHRSIKTVRHGQGCTTTYYRENHTSQVIWDTPSHADACAPKAMAFVADMAKKGMNCTPQ